MRNFKFYIIMLYKALSGQQLVLMDPMSYFSFQQVFDNWYNKHCTILSVGWCKQKVRKFSLLSGNSRFPLCGP